jgi:hypothetical protein
MVRWIKVESWMIVKTAWIRLRFDQDSAVSFLGNPHFC